MLPGMNLFMPTDEWSGSIAIHGSSREDERLDGGFRQRMGLPFPVALEAEEIANVRN